MAEIPAVYYGGNARNTFDRAVGKFDENTFRVRIGKVLTEETYRFFVELAAGRQGYSIEKGEGMTYSSSEASRRCFR